MSSQHVKHKRVWPWRFRNGSGLRHYLCALQCPARIVLVRNLRLACCLVVLVGTSPASADSAREALNETARCAAITDPAERLSCFDAAAVQAKGALAPQPADFGRPAPKPAEVPQLTAGVREFWKTGRGLAVFVLDNGQTWRQLEADATQILDPAPGTSFKVTIERGLLNSYNLTIDGRNGLIRVRRVQ